MELRSSASKPRREVEKFKLRESDKVASYSADFVHEILVTWMTQSIKEIFCRFSLLPLT